MKERVGHGADQLKGAVCLRRVGGKEMLPDFTQYV
jgi:hypothetical protein